MEIDAVDKELNSEKEAAWTAKEWLEWSQDDEQVYYMVKGKGKGRGKGKGGKGGNPWNNGGNPQNN